MKASELIARLQELVDEFGDQEATVNEYPIEGVSLNSIYGEDELIPDHYLLDHYLIDISL